MRTILEDPAALAAAAARLVADEIRAGLRSLVLTGGTTPGRAYEILARAGLGWGRVSVLFGDERCVPPDDPESNYRMARETLLDRVSPANIHRMAAELGAEEAAAAYAPMVALYEPLDLVLLGIGEDGHTASLFPGNPALEAAGLAVAVHGAPKPPPDRVSLTLGALRSARRVVILAAGEGKAEAVAAAARGEVPAGRIPGAEWLLDRAAASRLEAA